MNIFSTGDGIRTPGDALLYSARDTAGRMNISERLLFNLTKSGVIPHVRIGRRVLYRPEAIAAWLSGREQRGFGTGESEAEGES